MPHMGTSPPKLRRDAALRVVPVIESGAIIDSKYRVESSLAQGGMGVIVVARHLQLGHRVAIKLVRAGALDASSARRIVREARALALLKSEHVTRVLDVGELDAGDPFIVMELLEGMDLAQLLARSGRLSVADAATFLVQACDAIAEAHAQGIVHRDLKPSNLFLTRRRDGSPFVKLLDFGISTPPVDTSGESLTTALSGLGTPQYMAPEQFLDAHDADPRTDVWALGVVLYHLLTGQHLFKKESAPALQIAIGAAQAPRLRDKLPDAPEALDDLIVACLQKSREDRLQNVAEFVARLIPYADEDTQKRYAHLASGTPPVEPAIVSHAVTSDVQTVADTRAAWATRRTGEPARARRAVLVLGVMLAIGAVVGGFYYRRPLPSESASSSSIPAAADLSSLPAASAEPPARAASSVSSVLTTPSVASATSKPVKPAKRPQRAVPARSEAEDAYARRR